MRQRSNTGSFNRRSLLVGLGSVTGAYLLGEPLGHIAYGQLGGIGLRATAKNATKDTVTARFRIHGENYQVTGELLVDHPQYGYLILDSDGALAVIPPDSQVDLKKNSTPLVPTDAKELADKQLEFMPEGSKSIRTEHFVVCYNTTDAYARWNADLYENLYRGFYRFWKTKGIDLKEPRFPLVALIFESKDDYVQFASKEFASAESTFGYYHQETNRLASYDLTGVEGMLPVGAKVNRGLLVQEILSRPEAERTVATVIHEACHQLAFNSGLQTRLGANPLWLSEGLAMYFETPDLKTKTGWRKAGATNYHNLYNFLEYAPSRSEDSLTLLLTDDDRLKTAENRKYGYAEAWAFTHFLLQSKAKEFTIYLREIREIPVGTSVSGKDRLDLFCKCVGKDLARIDRDFLRHVQRLR